MINPYFDGLLGRSCSSVFHTSTPNCIDEDKHVYSFDFMKPYTESQFQQGYLVKRGRVLFRISGLGSVD